MPAVVAVVALIVVPLAIMVASLRAAPDALDTLQQRDAPVAVTVDDGAAWSPSTEVSVTVGFDAAAPAGVMAPPWKGTVTGLPAVVGSELRAGDPVIEIDGIRRVFAPSPAPFWRVPAWGDRGPDVDGLGAVLAAMQLMPAPLPGAPFGAPHVGAIEALATLLGAPPTATLDLGWLVWSPVPTAQMASLAVGLGGPAPAPGSMLLRLPRPITSVTVASTGGAPLTPDVVRLATLDFGADGVVPGGEVLDAPAAVTALRRLAEASASPSTGVPHAADDAAPPPGSGGAVGPSAAGGGRANGAGGASGAVRATLRGERVDRVAALPPGAVVTDPDGSQCLVTLARHPLPIRVVGSDAARVFVLGADGQQVAANPASAFGSTRCH